MKSKKAERTATINWRPWNDDTFDEAKDSDKLILLGISALWCHWCHRMDADVYANPAVVEFVNAEMIPIRVDVDRNPDISDRYNQGGFPTTCFLTPEGEILYGGTYVPLDEFREIMEQIAAYYKQNKREVVLRIQASKVQFITEIAFDSTAQLQDDYYDKFVSGVKDSFDRVFGGFGSGQKFPFPELVDFLYLEAGSTSKKEIVTHARKTLDAIRKGLFDKEEGGFFRYCVKEDWTEPHFEKIMDENFALVGAFLTALKNKPDEKYEDVIQKSVAYLKDAFWDEEKGVFYASCSADEEYYKLKQKARSESGRPAIDTTIFTNKNAVAASVLFRLAAYYKDELYSEMAQRIISFMLTNTYSKRNGFSHYVVNGSSERPGLLVDQVYMMKALLDAFEFTGDRRYIEYAEMTHAYIRGNLQAPKGGAFVDVNLCVGREYCDEILGRLSFINKPFLENSILMAQLARLSVITKNDLYLSDANNVQKFFSSEGNNFLNYGIIASQFVLASRLMEAPKKIYAIGRVVQGEIRDLLREVYNDKDLVSILIPLDQRMGGADIAALGLENKPEPNTVVAINSAGERSIFEPGTVDLSKVLA